MRRHDLIGAFLCVLAIWVQFMAPIATVTLASRDASATQIICAHDDGAPSATDDGGTLPAHPPHHHCPLCQVCLGGALIPERPAFTALDHPVSSPLRWRLDIKPAAIAAKHNPGQPRGPPTLV